jgi:hypothetical protein
MSNKEIANTNKKEETATNVDTSSLIKRCHNAYFNNQIQQKKVNESFKNEDSLEKQYVRLIVKDKFRKVVSENDIHKLEAESADYEIKRSRELEDLYQDCDGSTFLDDKFEKSKIPEFLLKSRKASRCADLNDNFAEENDYSCVSRNSFNYDFLNDLPSVSNRKNTMNNNVSILGPLSENNNSNDQINLVNDYNNLSLKEDSTSTTKEVESLEEKKLDPNFSSLKENDIPLLISFINNILNSNHEKNQNNTTIDNTSYAHEHNYNLDKYHKEDYKLLSNQQKFEILTSLYKKLVPDLNLNNSSSTTSPINSLEAEAYISSILKLENLTSNINSEIIDSGKIIKAYKSKLKSKNWNSYLINSRLTEMKNKYKFYHKCNFPSCNRTFSSSGWLKTHIEEHMMEIHSDEFNKDFEKYKFANKIKYIF